MLTKWGFELIRLTNGFFWGMRLPPCNLLRRLESKKVFPGDACLMLLISCAPLTSYIRDCSSPSKKVSTFPVEPRTWDIFRPVLSFFDWTLGVKSLLLWVFEAFGFLFPLNVSAGFSDLGSLASPLSLSYSLFTSSLAPSPCKTNWPPSAWLRST